MTTGISGCAARILSSHSRPDPSGSRTSRRTAAGARWASARSPSAPVAAPSTSYPSFRRAKDREFTRAASSSMMRTLDIRLLSRAREEHPRGRSLPRRALQLEGPAVQLRELAGDAEAEPGAARLGRVERLEHLGERGRRDARAVVADLHRDRVALAVGAQRDEAARGGGLERLQHE